MVLRKDINMLDDLRTIWSAFVEAIIRFWNNRFHSIKNSEVDFLRDELMRSRNDYKELVQSLNQPVIHNPKQIEDSEMYPIKGSRFEPFHVKRTKLEAASRNRAEALRKEAALEIERGKSTAELEEELGIN